jgi:REP element-mobilizing transposase RayT
VIIAHHLIWTAYGWWLPNDPRGSTSRTIRSDLVAELGEIHLGRKKVQPASADIRKFYENAKAALVHPLLEFSEPQRQIIADAFAEAMVRFRYTCYACAIMPDHVHILIRKHRDEPEAMIRWLQEAGAWELRQHAMRPPNHPVWGGPGWKVFLDLPDEIWRTIDYINGNPMKMGLPAQKWAFVKQYDNWPLHEGHSPNSPYATHGHGEAFRWKKKPKQ